MLKIPLLVSLGHHGGRRKVASLRPPFSTPLRSLGEPDPDTPFLVPIEHAPPLFVRIWEDKISLKIPPPPLCLCLALISGWSLSIPPNAAPHAGAVCTPDRPPRMFGSLASEVGQAVLSRTKWWEMSSRSRLGVEDCRSSHNKSLLVFRYPSGNQQEPLLKRVVLPNLPNPNTKKKLLVRGQLHARLGDGRRGGYDCSS